MLISSSGGHWVQLNRLVPAFSECDKVFVTTNSEYRSQVAYSEFHVTPDATRWNKFKMLWMATKMLVLLIKCRPDVVVTTGAAPGFFALFIAKKMGCKTVWIDSIANVDEMSLSGQKVRPHADLWLTQWEHLARPEGPHFMGAVL